MPPRAEGPRPSIPTGLLLAAALLLAACSERSAPPPAAAAERILSPSEGDTVAADFVVRLGITGARVVPATGTRVEGEGHHHVYVDVDLTPADSAIPKADGVYHLGSGADSLALQGVAPGPHRLIARFAYGDHVPMATVATDTVWIVVR